MDVVVTDNGTIEIIEVDANSPTIVVDNSTATTIEQLSTGPQGPPGTDGVTESEAIMWALVL